MAVIIIIINREGVETSVQAAEGLSIMEVIRQAGFDEIQALCGGCCACATCHVYVDDPDSLLEPMSEDEDDLLDAAEHRLGQSRLSCQLSCSPALDGLRVVIAPED